MQEDIRSQLDKKIAQSVARLAARGISVQTSVEQELSTTITHLMDIAAAKHRMLAHANQSLHTAEHGDSAYRVTQALPMATTAEHLFNIDVYNRMGDTLEYRGSPDVHGRGYYDFPGCVEIRLSPSDPATTVERYDTLAKTIFSSAQQFGLKAKLLNEQVNMSVWKDGVNLTSIVPFSKDSHLSGRIMMGMLDTCEDVWPLRPHRSPRLKLRPDYGVPIYAGSDARGYDSIRVVNEETRRRHHFEQLGDYMGGVVHSIPYRMLMMLDGVERGLDNAEYDKLAVPVSLLEISPLAHEATKNGLQKAFSILSDGTSCEVEKGHISNIDHVFNQPWGGPGHTIGKAITQEITGRNTPEEQERVKAFYKAIHFPTNNVIFPTDERFMDITNRFLSVPIEMDVRLHDSIRFHGSLVPDKATEEKRTQALRKRLGDNIVDAIAAPPQFLTQPEPAKPKNWRDYIRLPKPKAWAIE